MTDVPVPHKRLIVLLSVIIPFVVALLFRIKVKGYDLSFLPPIYASINGLTAILLIASFISIKKGNRVRHERLNKICIGLSCLFLILYISHHITSDETRYGGEGLIRYIYYFILITHVTLSILVIPFVLFTFSRALTGNFDGHKRLAKFTFPLWLYVVISGVVVYLMISPYYL
ncbi:MAG: Terminal oxidase biogenesis protein CtaM, putative heme A, heme O chaperone [Cytophagales bacterium]|jgi:putative membrane protein|nr:DUF420 domain-containing protein [Bacteroidota bacterium]MBS1981951.1 DUF420 domain-containing protein [Bacteroidota bacterium]WHZ09401.1 MAG: Terminal oxidase biogenesis protein CtaM, putative heme A, heme O chaperone [Cytophagales bacterium]